MRPPGLVAGRRVGTSSVLTLAATGTALCVVIAVAIAAARHASHAESSPVSPAGAWHTAWQVAVPAALVLYIAGVAAARRAGAPLRLVIAVAVVVQLVPLAGPLLLSKDVYSYWNHARILTVHGGNPYRDVADDYPTDPSYPYVAEAWRDTPSPYGPVWELAGVAPAATAGTDPHRAELAFRVFAVLGILATVAIVARRTRNAAAVALVGWSPLVALHFGGGGHNDAWLAALLALAALTASATSGAAYAVATLFKSFPAILVPLELARRRLRLPDRFWLGLAGGLALVAGVSFAAFGTSWLGRLLHAEVNASGLGLVHWLEELGLRYRYAVAIGAVLFLSVYVLALRSAWRTGVARLSLVTCVLCITSAQLRPWYGLWPLVLAAVEEDVAGGVAAVGLTTYLLLADAIAL